MLRVALTGGIATGKSHVRNRLEMLGVPTIDADVLARHALRPGTPGFAAVVARFGPGILEPGGLIDRRALGAIVFSDPAARRDLEAIVHPEVRDAMARWFASLPRDVPVAVADIPLLYETGRDRDFDLVIVAACAPETQLRRVMERDRLSAAEARLRIQAQLPIEEKTRRADYVISTDGSPEETDRQVDEVYHALRAAAR